MFDGITYKAGEGGYHTHNHEVKEYRALTDESVRLLAEFERVALEKVIGSYQLESNTFKATWWIIQERTSFKYYVKCRYMLNEKTYEFDVCLRDIKYTADIPALILERVQHEVARVLTIDLFKNNIRDLKEAFNL